MGKHRVQSFYGFTTFVFLLYFTNASKTQSSRSVIDVMKADENLQKFPPLVYKSNIAQNCSTVKYPETNVAAYNISTNTFLCLAFYDACHKAHSNPNQMELFSNNKFDYYLKRFFPGEKDTDQFKFCTNLGNVTISYKKLEPLLSQLVDLNKFYKCSRLCFTEAGDFNPFCAVIAWSKSIDKDAKMLNASQGMGLVDTSNIELKKKKTNVPKSDISPLKAINSGNPINKDTNDDEHNTVKLQSNVGNGMEMAKSSDSVPPLPLQSVLPPRAGVSSQSAVSPETVLPPQSVLSPQAVAGSDDPNKSQIGEPNIVDNGGQKMKSKVDSSTVDQQQVVSGSAVVHASDNLHEAPKNPSTSNNGPDESPKEATDDTKTSTISENTQDDNSANQEDWSHGEPYDTNDAFNQPNDPVGDQTQNGLDLSGQRNIISRYHSMSPDEESHVFTYFTVITLVSIAAYIGYHNKQKILAIILEGRRSRNSRGRRRPSTANYRKLDCTLEEAVTSQCNANVTHVIY